MKTKALRRRTAAIAVVVVCLSGTALAQGELDEIQNRPIQDVPDWERPPETRDLSVPSATAIDAPIATEPRDDSNRYSGLSDRAEKNQIGFANVRVGGGIEAPAASLRDDLAAGSLWTASVAVQPLSWLGLESGYTGSTFEVDDRLTGPENEGAVNGADFVRNGGYVAATVNLPTPLIQPYALGGVGIDRTSFRAADNDRFRDDTSGRVPLGGGLRLSAGPVIADLRGNYNVLFDQDFVRTSEQDENGANYDIGLQIGAQF